MRLTLRRPTQEQSPEINATATDAQAMQPEVERSEIMRQWEQSWVEYFRLDETRSESELQSLCERLRSLASSIS